MAERNPPKLDKVIGHREVKDAKTGETKTVDITVGSQITDDIAAGIPAYRAAARAGIHKDLFHRWERNAGRAKQSEASGLKLTRFDRLCIEFADAVGMAELERELRWSALLEQIARGGIEVQTITERVDAAGDVIDRTTKTTHTLPDPKVLLTKLRISRPVDYQEKVILAGIDVDGQIGAVSVEVRAESLADAARRFLEANADTFASLPAGNGHVAE